MDDSRCAGFAGDLHPKKPTKAVTLVLAANKKDPIGPKEWQFFETPYNKAAAGCGKPTFETAYNKENGASIHELTVSVNTPPFAMAKWWMTLHGEKCLYDAYGNAGVLTCPSMDYSVACKQHPDKADSLTSVTCVKPAGGELLSHRVAFCEW